MSVIDRIDPQILPIVRQVPVIDMADIPAARKALHAVYAAIGTAPPNEAVERSDHVAPAQGSAQSVQLRMFRPREVQGALPCLYWIQGGGYVLTAPDLDDEWCETIAHDQQCAVISVAWRRAPEHPYPAASDDCFNGLQWLMDNAEALQVDASKLVIGGASSGGGAAAALALRVRDQASFVVAHQLLIYPMLDDRDTTVSSHKVTDPELWNRTSNRLAWQAYLGAAYGTELVSPYAAPARMENLEDLPPATILTGELDLFRDENITYAQRLMHANVACELHVYPAVHHGFDRHMPDAEITRRFFSDRDNALARSFKLSGRR